MIPMDLDVPVDRVYGLKSLGLIRESILNTLC